MRVTGAIRKAVILARGLGTRMRRDESGVSLDAEQYAVAATGLKAMIRVGRPFLDYELSALADAGFERVCLVIGPEHEMVCDYYGPQPLNRIQVSVAIQKEALGTADAVLAAHQFAESDEFLAINGDNYYPVEVLNAIHALGRPGTVLFRSDSLLRASNIPTNRIQAFATCVVDVDGFLTDIIEKPSACEDSQFDAKKLISMNCWRFGPDIFAACREVPLSARGEYELPIAVKLAIRRGTKLKVAISEAGVLDLSRRSDIAAVAERLKNVRVEL